MCVAYKDIIKTYFLITSKEYINSLHTHAARSTFFLYANGLSILQTDIWQTMKSIFIICFSERNNSVGVLWRHQCGGMRCLLPISLCGFASEERSLAIFGGMGRQWCLRSVTDPLLVGGQEDKNALNPILPLIICSFSESLVLFLISNCCK